MSPAHDTDDATPQRSPSTSESHRSIQVDALHSNLSLHRLKNPAKETDTNDSSRGASISTATDHASDVASVRSKRTADVPELQPAGTAAPTLASQPPAPTVRSAAQQSPVNARHDDDTTTQPLRRTRHRSVMEPRSNRLSGFFTSLIHRRENLPTSMSRDPIREDPVDPLVPESSSRPSSPFPQRPPSPPPPSLPAPSLHDLGLSLSALTTELTPSHFTTPPFSGAFLSPHYLLLCHAQGLDVLPLVSPPVSQPYALVRRVSFKSVVVMEHRGVLVAIAGRRDGVRVYALEEVKRAVEWRMEMELRRERDRQRRENIKKASLRPADAHQEPSEPSGKVRRQSLSTPPPGDSDRTKPGLLRKSSQVLLPSPPTPPSVPPVPLIPRSAVATMPRKHPKNPTIEIPQIPTTIPLGQPPPYVSRSDADPPSSSFIPLRDFTANPLAPPSQRHPSTSPVDEDVKADWQSSDDEAIDVVAAGTSGEHLDERTSSTGRPSATARAPVMTQALPPRSNGPRRSRPSNLDLTLARPGNVPAPEPSPAPTLLTLRQALCPSPERETASPAPGEMDEDEEEEEAEAPITLAQMLLESRIPGLPPVGTMQPQEPILLSPQPDREENSSPTPVQSRANSIGPSSTRTRRRRRWSVMMSSPNEEQPAEPSPVPSTAPPVQSTTRFTRSHSFRDRSTPNLTTRSTTDSNHQPTSSVPDFNTIIMPSQPPSRSSRFFPRIFSNAFNGRRSDDRSPPPVQTASEPEGTRSFIGPAPLPPPKLEYVKLPGTKGALMIKAVETAKKSFLAILCGDSGEKVELFAGTYRTALGLSRTFILPDSPRSLELQLQGDDLVEVFLVFGHNVFGLEPATVRVREVRIGRAERRAARRRAREIRAVNGSEAVDEDVNVNVNIGVTVPSSQTRHSLDRDGDRPDSPALVASDHPVAQTERSSSPEAGGPPSNPPDDFVLLASAQPGLYTTFQQLNFAPNFPLASIADEYIIPPTYPEFVAYKHAHEPESQMEDSLGTSAPIQFTPPGLPLPTASTPSRWFYRDPKNVVHGPWKASLMQAWYKDGLLPPDLPVRREEDTDFTPLKDLRAQSLDPTQPFRPTVASSPPSTPGPELVIVPERPLLTPISLLAQPKHFGPPALFFSSRGGHSTSIVDARGRSVLKGKFIWTNEDTVDRPTRSSGKLGDVKRLEAFDVQERSVLVAMRQGGLEVVDLGDALLRPADESRTVLPHYNPPPTNVSRRPPFVWRIGTPLIASDAPNAASTVLPSRPSKGSGSFTSRKTSLGSARGVSGRGDGFGDGDADAHEEVLFLGRRDDDVYLCERNTVAFRILRLSPSTNHS